MSTRIASVKTRGAHIFLNQFGCGGGRLALQLTIDNQEDFTFLTPEQALKVSKKLRKWARSVEGHEVTHRTWRVLGCPWGHEIEFFDRRQAGDRTSYCPSCLASGKQVSLLEEGVVVLPFQETDPERPK